MCIRDSSVADYVFAQEHVDALLLEYDDARSGGFAPLAKMCKRDRFILRIVIIRS